MKNIVQATRIISIICLTGLLGGYGNFLGLSEVEFEIGESLFYRSKLQKSLIWGIIAAATVPLFLNVISSNLIDFERERISLKNYFIFGSFCLVAALFSEKFLSNAYESAASKWEIEKVEQAISNFAVAVASKDQERNIDSIATANNIVESQEKDILEVINSRHFIYEGDLKNNLSLSEGDFKNSLIQLKRKELINISKVGDKTFYSKSKKFLD